MRPDDLIVTIAYFSIPIQIVVALIRYPRLRTMPWPTVGLVILFALFIFLCGAGHLLRCLEMVDSQGFAYLNGATAFISLVTALYLIPLVPNLFEALDATLAAEMESKRKVMTFMSFLCHEIRNPLFAITSTITFMGDDEQLTKEQQASLECIEQSANLMLRLVNDVLDISRLESGKLQLEQRQFDLVKVIEGAASSFQRTVAQKQNGEVSFHLELGSTVPRQAIGDSVRLLQMMYNLLSNSTKFTEAGFIKFEVDTMPIDDAISKSFVSMNCLDNSARTVVTDDDTTTDGSFRISARHLRMEEGLVQPDPYNTIVLKLEVSDSGVGISPQQQEQIFKPYSQSKLSDYRKHGGTGLGLSIVNQLTKIMGGSIHLKSELGEGSMFTIYIPIKTIETCSLDRYPQAEGENIALLNSFTGTRNSSTTSHKLPHRLDNCFRESSTRSKVCSPLLPEDAKTVSITHAASLQLFETRRSLANSSTTPALQNASMMDVVAVCGITHGETKTREEQLIVLVVDDNAMNLKLIGRMLKKIGLTHVDAENGQIAVDFMSKSRNACPSDTSAPHVGLILMDWSMPVMDGCEATKAIRGMQLQVPIVALTACALEEGLQGLINAGCNEIATKPIIRDDLTRICHHYL